MIIDLIEAVRAEGVWSAELPFAAVGHGASLSLPASLSQVGLAKEIHSFDRADFLASSEKSAFKQSLDELSEHKQLIVLAEKHRQLNIDRIAHIWKKTPIGGYVFLIGSNAIGIKATIKKCEQRIGRCVEQISKAKGRIAYWQKSAEADNSPQRDTSHELSQKSHSVTLYHEKAKLGQQRVLSSHLGAFSHDKIDVGTQFLQAYLFEKKDVLAQEFEQKGIQLEALHIADLGAGLGHLSFAAHDVFPMAFIDACERDVASVACMQESAKLWPDFHDGQLKAQWWDARSEALPREKYELFVCNPPFHEGKATDSASAESMFQHMQKHAHKESVSLIVANIHLPYEYQLKKMAEIVSIERERFGFKIIKVEKWRPCD